MKFHELANIFPMMSASELAALRADIAKHGLREPIILAEGKIADGRNRYNACVELGVEPRFEAWDGIGSLVAFIVSMNLHRRHLNESQRAMVAAKLANMRQGARTDLQPSANLPEVSQPEAAQMLSVGERSLRSAKKVLTSGTPELARAVEQGKVAVSLAAIAAQLPEEKQIEFTSQVEAGEKPRNAYHKATQPKSVEPDKMGKAIVRERIEKGNGIVECVRCQNLYDGSNIEFCPYCAYTREERIAYLNQERQTHPPHVSHNAGDNEWYTPLEFIEAARDVMGNIDLDPASTLIANEVIQADKFYTKEDDGLSKDWAGKIWMNPPYASDLIGKFVSKLAKYVKRGQVTDAIVLVNNATETLWFSELIDVASVICFPIGRIRFWAPNKDSATPLQGQAIIYIGNEVDKFLARFQQFGWTARIFKGDGSSVS